jgi:hypothetical protein
MFILDSVEEVLCLLVWKDLTRKENRGPRSQSGCRREDTGCIGPVADRPRVRGSPPPSISVKIEVPGEYKGQNLLAEEDCAGSAWV